MTKYLIIGLLFLAGALPAQTFKTTSVLASGQWARLSAKAGEGMYRLNKGDVEQFLKGLPDGYDPRRLRLYGAGYVGMLPQRNSDFDPARHDDLVEMPVEIVGEADGRFDDGDYMLFYGASAHAVRYDRANKRFDHEQNLYADEAYYYLTYGDTPGLRVTDGADPGAATATLSTLPSFSFLDEDKYNLVTGGRLWFGDKYDFQTTYNYTFPTPDAAPGVPASLRMRVAGRHSAPTSFSVKSGGQTLGRIDVAGVSTEVYFAIYAALGSGVLEAPAPQNNQLNLTLTYNKTGAAVGWLDFMQVTYTRQLTAATSPLLVTCVHPTEAGGTAELNVQGLTDGHRLWAVGDDGRPYRVAAVRNGDKATVRLKDGHRLLAFSSSQAVSPTLSGAVANQNLHALPAADYLLVTNPNFLAHANELAAFHRRRYRNDDGSPRRVHVVTTEQIVQEFGAGRPDVSAIRNFVRMFYLRAGDNEAERPKFLTLFGDGTYDFKNVLKQDSTFKYTVPTYQARESLDPTEAFASDDYFTFLDSTEGFWGEGVSYYNDPKVENNHKLDLSVGRLPAHNLANADTYVDKIINYITNAESFGTWRNRALLMADYTSGQCYHMQDADGLDKDYLTPCTPWLTTDKIYLDSFKAENVAEGVRYPSAKVAILEQMQRGHLLMNYTGHGAEDGWSNSYIFEPQDVAKLKNGRRLPFLVTATCDYGRFDNPNRVCGAELLMNQPGGGTIGVLTAVRLVSTGGNNTLNRALYDDLFLCQGMKDHVPSFGEAYMRMKNRIYPNYQMNTRCFSLLADPGIAFAEPQVQAVVTHLNGAAVDETADTLKALQRVSLSGEVRDRFNYFLENYNGEVIMTVYDKPQVQNTINCNWKYNWRKNILFSGRASVVNGRFDASFVVPLDISYEIGKGKISLYTFNDSLDGHGSYDNLVVCCTDLAAPECVDTDTPTVYIRMDDSAEGVLTGATPLLVIDVDDGRGVNTSTIGIGREMVAVIDGQDHQPYILNSYYVADLGRPGKGRVSFRLPELPEGEHTVRIKVWNVCNRSGTAVANFRVLEDHKVGLMQTFNYPNPFNGVTTFHINHNQAGKELDFSIRIFDMTGRTVRTLRQTETAASNVTLIPFDGTTAGLTSGVYLYEIVVQSSGASARSHGRLMFTANE